MTKIQRVLPADVYDTLEFAALVYGGIGWGPYFDGSEDCPVCAHALLAVATDAAIDPYHFMESGPFSKLLQDSEIYGLTSDAAVRRIVERKTKRSAWAGDGDERVSFAEWRRELNIVRGDS